MLLLRRPSDRRLAGFLRDQQARPFTYSRPGMTRGRAPQGYRADHQRIRLGQGAAAWVAAQAAIRRWAMFDLGWVQVGSPAAPIAAGSTVAVVSRQFGFWALNACRLVYVIQDDGAVECFGFAYGTLPEHMAQGEERFTVEWHHAGDSVWYDLLAYSRPHHPLARAGYPVIRLFQHRFARDSLRAMQRAVAATLAPP